MSNVMDHFANRILGSPSLTGTSSAAGPSGLDLADQMAGRLHPSSIEVAIEQVIDETPSTRSFWLRSTQKGIPLPPVLPGQYVGARVSGDGWFVTRPYAVSGVRCQVAGTEYQITIRRKPGGFFSEHIWANWKPGVQFSISGPQGNFFYNPLRDSREVILIAGGSGIAPFLPMIPRLLAPPSPVNRVHLLYGSRTASDVIFRRQLDELGERLAPRLSLTYFVDDGSGTPWASAGPLNAQALSEALAGLTDPTAFLCGPYGMYEPITNALLALNVPPRRIRSEVRGEAPRPLATRSVADEPPNSRFTVSVDVGRRLVTIEGTSGESILNCLERAGIRQQSSCRSGECGACRCQVLEGVPYVDSRSDQRRAHDQHAGFVYACCTYPVADVRLRVFPS